jgi:hypothetical protein
LFPPCYRYSPISCERIIDRGAVKRAGKCHGLASSAAAMAAGMSRKSSLVLSCKKEHLQGSKHFFFAKKKQKIFMTSCFPGPQPTAWSVRLRSSSLTMLSRGAGEE